MAASTGVAIVVLCVSAIELMDVFLLWGGGVEVIFYIDKQIQNLVVTRYVGFDSC